MGLHIFLCMTTPFICAIIIILNIGHTKQDLLKYNKHI